MMPFSPTIGEGDPQWDGIIRSSPHPCHPPPTSPSLFVLDSSLCRQYALRGMCRFRDKCHFSHALPHDCSDWNEACRRIPCPDFHNGFCRYGDHCRLAHLTGYGDNDDDDAENDNGKEDGAYVTSSYDDALDGGDVVEVDVFSTLSHVGQSNSSPTDGRPQEAQDVPRGDRTTSSAQEDGYICGTVDTRTGNDNTRTTSLGKEVMANSIEKYDKKRHEGEAEDDDLICGICLEPLGRRASVTEAVADDAVASCRRKMFGLLAACDHVFCVQCLRTWRSEQKKEAVGAAGGGDDLFQSLFAPNRNNSSSSSDRVRACPACRRVSDFVVPSDKYCTGAEKAAVVQSYQARLSCIPCKRFTGKLGSCPFGKDCFYSHRDPPRDGRDMKPLDMTKQELWQERQRRQQMHRQQLEFQPLRRNLPGMPFYDFQRPFRYRRDRHLPSFYGRRPRPDASASITSATQDVITAEDLDDISLLLSGLSMRQFHDRGDNRREGRGGAAVADFFLAGHFDIDQEEGVEAAVATAQEDVGHDDAIGGSNNGINVTAALIDAGSSTDQDNRRRGRQPHGRLGNRGDRSGTSGSNRSRHSQRIRNRYRRNQPNHNYDADDDIVWIYSDYDMDVILEYLRTAASM